jgi:hypothetical protein
MHKVAIGDARSRAWPLRGTNGEDLGFAVVPNYHIELELQPPDTQGCDFTRVVICCWRPTGSDPFNRFPGRPYAFKVEPQLYRSAMGQMNDKVTQLFCFKSLVCEVRLSQIDGEKRKPDDETLRDQCATCCRPKVRGQALDRPARLLRGPRGRRWMERRLGGGLAHLEPAQGEG